jgi:hypothetical protein
MPSRLVFAGRLLLLLLAALAVVVAFLVARREDRAAGVAGRYSCPMHPDVVSTMPGTCPICRMDLEATDVPPVPSAGPQSTLRSDIVRKRIFTADVRAPAWVEEEGTIAAILYKDEVPTLVHDEPGVFLSGVSQGASVAVRVAPDPPVPWDRATVRVRCRVDVEEGAASRSARPEGGRSEVLRAGEVGWVRLLPRRREVPMIPASAVLTAAEGPFVLVAAADGRSLRKRPVEIGRTFGGMVAVVAGLHHRERVLIQDAFFLDAERRLRREESIAVTP